MSRATGANDTPLGTPIRMSPITDTPSSSSQTTAAASSGQAAASSTTSQAAEPNTKKRESPDVTEPVKKCSLLDSLNIHMYLVAIVRLLSRKMLGFQKRKSLKRSQILQIHPTGRNPMITKGRKRRRPISLQYPNYSH
jgi:hypothetical protein